MNLSDKELRKLLNAAWDAGQWWEYITKGYWATKKGKDRRYRDVTKIIKEAKENEDGMD